jgi:hypothetical protein
MPPVRNLLTRDVIDTINEFQQHAHLKNIRVEIKKSLNNANHLKFNRDILNNGKEIALNLKEQI